jgi:adenosylmethionine-8-amino-7-oxononanoate aminotransferase
LGEHLTTTYDMGQCLSSPRGQNGLLPKAEVDVLSEVSDQPAVVPLLSPGRPFMSKAKGHYLHLDDGQKLLDGCGGAGVACIGHGRREVATAISNQARKFSYVSWAHFDNQPTQELSDWLIRSTDGKMGKVFVMCSGNYTSTAIA